MGKVWGACPGRKLGVRKGNRSRGREESGGPRLRRKKRGQKRGEGGGED